MEDDSPVPSGKPSMEERLAALYAQVPDDFPRPQHLGAVSGAQPKLLASEYRGRFYAPGCTPPELHERWLHCTGIVRQLEVRSLESKLGKRRDMTETAILEQYLTRLIATRWTSEPEARWVIRKVAELLDWTAPAAAVEPTSAPQGD